MIDVRGPSLSARLRSASVPMLFLLPSLVLLGLFSVWPLFHTIWTSFHDWRILQPAEFIGWDNYAALAGSDHFWVALRNTLIFGFVTVPLGLVLALGSALLLNRAIAGRAFYRGVIFFPVLMPMIVIALVWRWMFSENYGVVNGWLEAIGVEPQAWLGQSPALALGLIMAMSVWKGFGYGMVFYLAGLQTIPRSLHESAKLDGAGRWQAFWHVTLPLLNPVTLFVAVIAFIGSFQVFDQVYVMTGGGPGHATSVLVHYIYEVAYVRFRMGLACAAACVLLLLTLAVTAVQFTLIRSKTEEAR